MFKRLVVLLGILLIAGCNDAPVKMIENPVLDVLQNTVIITDGMGHGSAVILSDGCVLTAAHCVQNDMGMIRDNLVIVTLDGSVYGIDEVFVSSVYDVALVKVPDIVGHVELATNLEMLNHVWLIGAPLDQLLIGTITEGYLVNLDRDIYNWIDAIQVSAISAPGNSGGPVVNDQGELMGLLVGGPTQVDPYSICEPIQHIIETINESGWLDAEGS